jgi:hypothetical protein
MDSTIFPLCNVELRLFSEEPLVLLESFSKARQGSLSRQHSSTQPTDWFSGKMGEQTAQACAVA